jgi:hypothetical protein
MSKNALLPNSVQFFIGHGSCINQLTSQQGDIEIEADLKYFLAAVLYQFDGRCQLNPAAIVRHKHGVTPGMTRTREFVYNGIVLLH